MKVNVDPNFTSCGLTVFHVARIFVYLLVKLFNSIGWLRAVTYITAGERGLFLVKFLKTSVILHPRRGRGRRNHVHKAIMKA